MVYQIFYWKSIDFSAPMANNFLVFVSSFPGDEILAVNGLALQGMSHSEAISVFKNIRVGRVVLHVARRDAASRR